MKYRVLERDFVDGDGVLSGEVLQHAGEEGLREEETAEPEAVGGVVVDPILEELESVP
jgi:hypothetical protein